MWELEFEGYARGYTTTVWRILELLKIIQSAVVNKNWLNDSYNSNKPIVNVCPLKKTVKQSERG